MSKDYVSVTEISGDYVTKEQVQRMARRYYWAEGYCADRDVLEIGCGTGQGAGLLTDVSKTYVAGDISESVLELARSHYGERIDFRKMDALNLEIEESSVDVVLISEAIYYLSDLDRFLVECCRVLRDGGALLIVTANKDLYDFNASEHSCRYLGVVELGFELGRYGFEVRCFGDTPVNAVALRQRLLRPLKATASRLGLIPKSMDGKKLLKRFVFGGLEPMPSEITYETARKQDVAPLDMTTPDRLHKVILCEARLT